MTPERDRKLATTLACHGNRLTGRDVIYVVEAKPSIMTGPHDHRSYTCRHGGARASWLDDETVAVQRGDKGLPNSATYSLNVGGAK
jgi:hypothetical protein